MAGLAKPQALRPRRRPRCSKRATEHLLGRAGRWPPRWQATLRMRQLSIVHLRLVRPTPRISCEGRTTVPWFAMTAGRGMADHDASTRLQPPLVCCIRLFCRPLRSPTHAVTPASSPGPDRTPDPLHGARLRDPGGRGTARPFKPERTGQAAPPPLKGRMAAKGGAPPSDRPHAHQGGARSNLSREGPSAAHTRGAPME